MILCIYKAVGYQLRKRLKIQDDISYQLMWRTTHIHLDSWIEPTFENTKFEVWDPSVFMRSCHKHHFIGEDTSFNNSHRGITVACFFSLKQAGHKNKVLKSICTSARIPLELEQHLLGAMSGTWLVHTLHILPFPNRFKCYRHGYYLAKVEMSLR